MTRRPQSTRYYFAYGSNMHVPSMRVRCPRARLIAGASLAGWEFLINAHGYATIRKVAGATVHGALWSITARHESVLDVYEDVANRLYEKIMVDVVTRDALTRNVLTYVATDQRAGRPRAGYMQLVRQAASDLSLPDAYREFLTGWP